MHRYAKMHVGDLPRNIRRLEKNSVVHDLCFALYAGQTSDKMGKYLNETFEIDIPPADWKAALEPVHKTTLWRLCEFIADNATLPAIEPVTVLGCASESAGAFLAMRSIIWDHIRERPALRPSTRLNHIGVGRNPETLFLELWKLAPAALPKLTFKDVNLLSSERRLLRDRIVRSAKWAIGVGLLVMAGCVIVALGTEAANHLLRREDLIGFPSFLVNALLPIAFILIGAGPALGIAAAVLTLRGTSYRMHYPNIETLGELARFIAENKGKAALQPDRYSS